ncbi:MAG: hypothetical protein ABMA00_02615 [Gemmatimonas sp.]
MRNILLKGSILAIMMMAATACDSAAPTSSVSADPSLRASGGNGGGSRGGSGADNRGGGSNSGSALTFLSPAAGAPDVSTGPVSFYAVQGQDRIGEVAYVDPTSGGNGMLKLLRLRIRSRTQIIRPNGAPLAPGDSILITIQVIDPVGLIAQFEPAGLKFAGKDPAVLTMWFGATNDDLNHDGVVSGADSIIQQTFSIFRQASVGAPWTRIQSTLSAEVDEISASIPGFSNYVIAY